MRRLFPHDIEIIAEPGRFMVATSSRIGFGDNRKSQKRRQNLLSHKRRRISYVLRCVYDHLDSNFRAFRQGRKEVCAVVGPTCDSFDKISVSEQLPGNLEIGDYLYTEI